MHLLNAATLELEEFQSNKIPPYAILSHTWGNTKDEVTFRDVSSYNIGYKHKPGFQKIKFCTTQTLEDGFQYCWIDTCCIDKSSSAELSEAINSMYAWYKNSEACYVYLADVVAQRSTTIDSQLEKSRWFTRGWTLQELLAPQRCQFFDTTWVRIGMLEKADEEATRPSGFLFGTVSTASPRKGSSQGFESHRIQGDLADTISRITGIARDFLLRNNPSLPNLATRMSWASRRETTRVEDIAYCLLGIFGVNMPLLYGEGEKAFIRLQEEIIKKSADDTIFAWTDEGAPRKITFQGLLAPSPQYFDWITTREIISTPSERPQTYNMTNNGLRIQLPLLPFPGKPDECFAKLNCMIPDEWPDQGSCHDCFIILKKVSPPDIYARIAFRTYGGLLFRFPGAFTPSWICVPEFFDNILKPRMHDKISRVVFKSHIHHKILWKGISTNHAFDFNSLVLSVEPGHAIEVDILLYLTGDEGDPGIPFGWRITTDGAQRPECYYSRLASDSLEELQREDLDWRPDLEIANTILWTNMNFAIRNGELTAELLLGGIDAAKNKPATGTLR